MSSTPVSFGSKRSVVVSKARAAPWRGVRWVATWVVVLAAGVAFWVGVAFALSDLM